MSYRLDISQGIDPVPVYSDIVNDNYTCFVDGVRYRFSRLPFTLKEVKMQFSKRPIPCADKTLILKHADKANVKDVRTLETLRG